MTRAEFAKSVVTYWKQMGMNEGESFSGFAKRTKGEWWDDGTFVAVVADVATNGFDPEPDIATLREEADVMQRAVDNYLNKQVSLAHERAGEAAKRSRPFVGSHKLPYDSDWD